MAGGRDICGRKSIMRATGTASGEQLAGFLPQPLLDNFRLSESYTSLVELARSASSDLALVVRNTFQRQEARRRAASHPDMPKAVRLLARALQDCDEKDSVLCGRFDDLLEIFQSFGARDRKRLLATLQKVSESCLAH